MTARKRGQKPLVVRHTMTHNERQLEVKMANHQQKSSNRQRLTDSHGNPTWTPYSAAFSLVRRAFRGLKDNRQCATLGAALALLGGCQSYDDAVRDDLRQYLGRPARVFFEDKALTVTQMYDRPNGQRVYIAPYKLCGFTVVADAGYTSGIPTPSSQGVNVDSVAGRPIVLYTGEYITAEITKSC